MWNTKPELGVKHNSIQILNHTGLQTASDVFDISMYHVSVMNVSEGLRHCLRNIPWTLFNKIQKFRVDVWRLWHFQQVLRLICSSVNHPSVGMPVFVSFSCLHYDIFLVFCSVLLYFPFPKLSPLFVFIRFMCEGRLGNWRIWMHTFPPNQMLSDSEADVSFGPVWLEDFFLTDRLIDVC